MASVRGGGGYWRVSPRHPVCQRDLRLNAFRNFFFFFFTETYLGNFIAPFQTHFMFKMHILCLITNACALAVEEELQNERKVEITSAAIRGALSLQVSLFNTGEELENVCLRKSGVVPACGGLDIGQFLVQVEDGWVEWLDKGSDRTW